jgi:hypothetical protein
LGRRRTTPWHDKERRPKASMAFRAPRRGGPTNGRVAQNPGNL